MGAARKIRRKEPEMIVRNGKPSAVILPIAEYEELLERAEDASDLKRLDDMRKKPLKFRSLDEFIKGYRRRV